MDKAKIDKTAVQNKLNHHKHFPLASIIFNETFCFNCKIFKEIAHKNEVPISTCLHTCITGTYSNMPFSPLNVIFLRLYVVVGGCLYCSAQ